MMEQHKLDTVEKLSRIDAKLDQILKGYNRIIYTMLGIIAATIGSKFIGSPPWVIIAGYMAWFTGTFLLANVILTWKEMPKLLKAIRLSFSMMLFFSVGVRTFVYKPGIEVAPIWYSPIVDCFYIVLCILLAIRAWKRLK